MYKGRSSGRLSARFDSVPAIPDWRSRFSYFLAGIIKSPVSSKFINFLQHLKALMVWHLRRLLQPFSKAIIHISGLKLITRIVDSFNLLRNRKFFSSGRFAPAAEISGLRSETAPANKPSKPG